MERLLVQLQPARLDLGEVQDVVDDGQQRLSRVMRHPQELLLSLRQRRILEQPDHAHHAVQRRPNLVAHVGQELGLGEAGSFGDLAGFVEFRERVLQRGDILRRTGDPAGLALRIPEQGQGDENGEARACLRQPHRLFVAHEALALAARRDFVGVRMVVGGHDPLERLTDQLLPGPPVGVHRRLIHLPDDAGEVLNDDRVGRLHEHRGEFLEPLLAPHALGDVPSRGVDEASFAVGTPLKPTVAAVFAAVAVDELEHLLPGSEVRYL